MDLLDDEREQPIVVASSGIDRSLGYLALGLAVVCFFVLMVFGMGRVEKLTKGRVLPESQRGTAVPTEIGGVER